MKKTKDDLGNFGNLSNLGVLTKIMRCSQKSLAESMGIHSSLLSFWETGRRLLKRDSQWVKIISEWLIEYDSMAETKVITKILQVFYPSVKLDDPEQVSETLEHWLTNREQLMPSYIEHRKKQIAKAIFDDPSKQAQDGNGIEMAYGIDNIQSEILSGISHISNFNEPGVITLVLMPDSHSILSHNDFILLFLDQIDILYKKGFKVKLALNKGYRCAYKTRIIAEIIEYLLKYHISGFVESYYYDRSMIVDKKLMIGLLSDKVSFTVEEGENGELVGKFNINSGKSFLSGEDIAPYLQENSRYYFRDLARHGSVFNRSNQHIECLYSYQQMPFLGVSSSFGDSLKLSGSEAESIKNYFTPLVLDSITSETEAYCIFSSSSIDAALELSRCKSFLLSKIYRRNIFVSTQTLIDNLVILAQMIKHNRNAHISFLADNDFENIPFKIHTAKGISSICWTKNGEYIATCEDYAMEEISTYCEQIWKGLSDELKSRALAETKLNNWLLKAKKYGYNVPAVI